MKEPEDEAFEELSRRQGDWGLQGSRKHQIIRYAENNARNEVIKAMTQDEIIEMVQEAGGSYFIKFHKIIWIGTSQTDFLERFAKLVAEKAFQNGYEKGVAAFNDAVLLEREACAKLCEQSAQNYYPVIPEASGACTHLAAAIRARGQA